MLLGCESAAAEPFLGNLCFSDNRFELNWFIGRPVPLYAYLYHEYLRNFMGNQVSSPFTPDYDTLRFRMAYAYTAGDCLTLVCTPDGGFMVNWGCHDFSKLPDREKTIDFAANLQAFYRNGAKKYLLDARMRKPLPYHAQELEYGMYGGRIVRVPAVLSSAWQAADGSEAQLFVNHTDLEQRCTVGEDTLVIPPLSAVLYPL
jgi:hypothetical protein